MYFTVDLLELLDLCYSQGLGLCQKAKAVVSTGAAGRDKYVNNWGVGLSAFWSFCTTAFLTLSFVQGTWLAKLVFLLSK